jgi:hypothetical protein
MKLPVSKTVAFLPCNGLNNRKATKHIYSHSELVTVNRATGLGHFFRCQETGELRRWGFDRTFSKDDGSN